MSMIICLQDLISDFNIEKQIFKYLAGGEKEGWGKETCLQDLISNTLTRRIACRARYMKKGWGKGSGIKTYVQDLISNVLVPHGSKSRRKN